jgi:predicted nucleic acid-binding protein
MSRFVVDVGVVLRMAEELAVVSGDHRLPAPTLLRSQTLSALHKMTHAGTLPPGEARDRLEWIWREPIRLLGDAVLRRRAWDVADRMGWADTYIAEYIPLTQLQADAFVTLDSALAHDVSGLVRTATFDALH